MINKWKDYTLWLKGRCEGSRVAHHLDFHVPWDKGKWENSPWIYRVPRFESCDERYKRMHQVKGTRLIDIPYLSSSHESSIGHNKRPVMSFWRPWSSRCFKLSGVVGESVWLIQLATSSFTRLTSSLRASFAPLWSCRFIKRKITYNVWRVSYLGNEMIKCISVNTRIFQHFIKPRNKLQK